MAVEPIKLEFSNQFEGELIANNGKVEIGANKIRPYNMLLGALGSCFYATFLEVVNKKRLTFTKASLEIEGTKRQEIPTTLNTVTIRMVIEGASDRKKFLKSAELGAKYCSVYETIKQVADIRLDVEFK